MTGMVTFQLFVSLSLIYTTEIIPTSCGWVARYEIKNYDLRILVGRCQLHCCPSWYRRLSLWAGAQKVTCILGSWYRL